MANGHEHLVQVRWSRAGAAFLDNRYSRAHTWQFDGGLTVPASSSPSVVPLPFSNAEAVDPEEAFVASVSSCHMLWFLSLAAKKGFVIDSYVDNAVGEMAKNGDGKLAVTRVTLRPKIEFTGESVPSPADIRALHHAAHEECFIASSIRSEIVIA